MWLPGHSSTPHPELQLELVLRLDALLPGHRDLHRHVWECCSSSETRFFAFLRLWRLSATLYLLVVSIVGAALEQRSVTVALRRTPNPLALETIPTNLYTESVQSILEMVRQCSAE